MGRSYTRNLVHSHPVFSKKCTFSMPISKARQEGLKKLFALADLGTPLTTHFVMRLRIDSVCCVLACASMLLLSVCLAG